MTEHRDLMAAIIVSQMSNLADLLANVQQKGSPKMQDAVIRAYMLVDYMIEQSNDIPDMSEAVRQLP